MIESTRSDRLENIDDPAVGPFLHLIERDLRARPQVVRPVTQSCVAKLRELVGGVQVDLDARLEDQD